MAAAQADVGGMMPPSQPQSVSRRQFLQTAAVASLAVQCGPWSSRAAGAAPAVGATSPHWFERPMRFANLTLVDDDPGRFDPQFWLEYFQRIHADCATISAGGYLAYYPTDLPLHRRSAYLGDGDAFGALYHGCRELGMNVIARIDPHVCRDEVRKAHPDWISTDARGEPRRHHGMPELWITCALGPYHFDFMRGVIRELVGRYPVDAVFSNRWNGLGWCYCENCRRNFRAATGLEIPRTEREDEPARKAFIAWQQARLFELWDRWDAAVRSQNPNACFIPNMGAGIWQFLDMREIGRRASILFADRQGRTAAATNGSSVTPPWAIGRAAKEFRAVMGRKPVGAGYSVGVEEPYRWKDSVQSVAEQQVWMADGIANGLLLSFGKTGGRVRDRRWMDFTAELFQWHNRNERWLRNVAPLAQVGLVYSQRNATRYGRPWRRDEDPTMRHYQAFVETTYQADDHVSGMYHALVEARIPFEMVCDRMLDREHLAPYRLLILPNLSVLDDGQCEQLRAFVRRGGSLVATYETSLYSEQGSEPRDNFGLADLFGARFRATPATGALNAYVALDHGAAEASEILHGFDGVPHIIGGVWQLDVDPVEASYRSPLAAVPPYPHLPMEEVYPRTDDHGKPQLLLRRHGSARVAYFPWDVDRLFWETLLEDHARLLASTIRWALNTDPVVTVEGPGLLDVVPWRQAGSLTVHLVNLTNPYAMKGPFREILPVGPQRVRIQLNGTTRPTAVRLLVADREVPWSVDGSYLELTVPEVRDREVIGVEVES